MLVIINSRVVEIEIEITITGITAINDALQNDSIA